MPWSTAISSRVRPGPRSTPGCQNSWESLALALNRELTGKIHDLNRPILLSHLQASRSKGPEASCRESDSARIIRFDDRSNRVFAIAQAQEIDNVRGARAVLKPIQEAITKCRTSWDEKWSVSFFTDRKYAVYKDEPQVREYLADGTWNRAYVAEYDHTSQRLTLYPLDPKKAKSRTVKLTQTEP